MKKAIIYARVSTAEQAASGTSLEQQQERGFDCAERRDFVAVRVCVDAGITGTRYETRPGIIEAIEAIERKEAELLIVTKVDRIGRSARIILQIAERIDRAGGQIITCDGMELGRTPIGKLTLNNFAGMAEFERDMIRERGMDGRRARAQQGVQPTRSRPPYGYHIVNHKDVDRGVYPKELTGQYIIMEDKAQWVREIFTRYAGGMSLRGLAAWLESQGVPTSRGGRQWGYKTLQVLMQNPVYKGAPVFGRLETLHDESLITLKGRKTDVSFRVRPEKEWVNLTSPALVDEQTWGTCQQRLATNRELMSGNPKRKYMLSSLIRCPICGYKMAGTQIKSKRIHGPDKFNQYYVCHPLRNGCVAQNWSAQKAEAAVVTVLEWAAKHPALIADALRAYNDTQVARSGGHVGNEIDRLTEEQRRLEKELHVAKETMKAALRAGLKPEDFETDFAEIAKRRSAVEARLAELATPRLTLTTEPESEAETLALVSSAIVKALTATEELYTASEKQALLARIVESVTPNKNGADVRLLSDTVYLI